MRYFLPEYKCSCYHSRLFAKKGFPHHHGLPLFGKQCQRQLLPVADEIPADFRANLIDRASFVATWLHERAAQIIVRLLCHADDKVLLLLDVVCLHIVLNLPDFPIT